MAVILIFFVFIQISPTGLVLELNLQSWIKLSKEYVTLNEASRANLNVDKRMLKSPPFCEKGLYSCQTRHSPKVLPNNFSTEMNFITIQWHISMCILHLQCTYLSKEANIIDNDLTMDPFRCNNILFLKSISSGLLFVLSLHVCNIKKNYVYWFV